PEGVTDKPTSWKAAVWPDGGSAAVVLHDTTDMATRDAVGQLLRRLATEPGNGIDRVIAAAELHRLGGFPGAAFLVHFKPGYTIGLSGFAPVVTDLPAGGTHGYLNDVPAMRAGFIIDGPGVHAGKDLGIIDQRAIAPTLATFLGVNLSGAEVSPVVP